MTNTKNFDWKPAAFLYGAILLAFLIGIIHIKTQRDFDVNHVEKTEQTVTEKGGYVAGGPEYYLVQISPALCWKLSKNGTGTWRTAGCIGLLLLGVFIALLGTRTFEFTGHTSNYIVYISMVLVAACLLAAYSSAFSNNTADVPPDIYNTIKGDYSKLAELFTSKPLIK